MNRPAPLALLLCASLAGCGDPIVSRAEQSVRATLRDPDSATFSDIYKCGDTEIVTGKVNAKNGFGGYEGPRDFVADGSDAATDGGPTASSDSMDTFLRLMTACTKALEAQTARIRKQPV